jgi:hypothetical protein
LAISSPAFTTTRDALDTCAPISKNVPLTWCCLRIDTTWDVYVLGPSSKVRATRLLEGPWYTGDGPLSLQPMGCTWCRTKSASCPFGARSKQGSRFALEPFGMGHLFPVHWLTARHR